MLLLLLLLQVVAYAVQLETYLAQAAGMPTSKVKRDLEDARWPSSSIAVMNRKQTQSKAIGPLVCRSLPSANDMRSRRNRRAMVIPNLFDVCPIHTLLHNADVLPFAVSSPCP